MVGRLKTNASGFCSFVQAASRHHSELTNEFLNKAFGEVAQKVCQVATVNQSTEIAVSSFEKYGYFKIYIFGSRRLL